MKFWFGFVVVFFFCFLSICLICSPAAFIESFCGKLLFVAHWATRLPLCWFAGFLCRQYPSTFCIIGNSFIRLFLMVEIKLLKRDEARTQLTTNRIKIKTCWKLFGMMSFLWHSAPWFCCHWQKVTYSNSSGYKICLNWIFLWVLHRFFSKNRS